MEFPKKIIALRSLVSPHHAKNIQPSIFSVTWNLGKRCNYDCSYCPPTLHDWASPHIPLEKVQGFVERLDAWAQKHQRTVKYSLSGGEPFVHPHILDILSIIRSSAACEDIFVSITNGSLPLDLYQRALQYLSNITVSLHFERSQEEINAIVDKIITLTADNPTKMISVQVMMLPGKFDFIKTVLEKFDATRVKYVIRRIRPKKYDSQTIFSVDDEKQLLKNVIEPERNNDSRRQIKKFLQENLSDIYANLEYYSQQELDWMSTNIPTSTWQNVGVWGEDGSYGEYNSDDLVNRNLNQFQGWQCYIGVDCAVITDDGHILRGACGNDPPICHIDDFVEFDDTPTTCGLNLCLSNPDLTTRKSRPEFQHLINSRESL